MIFLNYKRFIKARQLFSLQLVHSIAARTVMVTGLPPHLRSERVLAEHFENMKLSVESVSICREISSLEHLIEARTRALLKLEDAWVQYVGNPSTVETYDQSDHAIIGDGDLTSTEAQVPNRFVVPHHRRPTIRPGWLSGRVDAIEFLEKRFLEADEAVKRHRRTGRFKPMDVGFVTFEKMSSAVRDLFDLWRQNVTDHGRSKLPPRPCIRLHHFSWRLALRRSHVTLCGQTLAVQMVRSASVMPSLSAFSRFCSSFGESLSPALRVC